MCLSADGRWALFATGQWDMVNGECLHTFDGHMHGASSVCLSADERYALSGGGETLRLWEVATGECLGILRGHERVTSVSLSGDGKFALSGSPDGTPQLWFLDWELEERATVDWDESARCTLQMFLAHQIPYAASLPIDREPTEDEVRLSLTRRGKPTWTEEDFRRLLYTLGCAGYGWLRPEGVRRKLEEMASKRSPGCRSSLANDEY